MTSGVAENQPSKSIMMPSSNLCQRLNLLVQYFWMRACTHIQLALKLLACYEFVWLSALTLGESKKVLAVWQASGPAHCSLETHNAIFVFHCEFLGCAWAKKHSCHDVLRMQWNCCKTVTWLNRTSLLCKTIQRKKDERLLAVHWWCLDVCNPQEALTNIDDRRLESPVWACHRYSRHRQ